MYVYFFSYLFTIYLICYSVDLVRSELLGGAHIGHRLSQRSDPSRPARKLAFQPLGFAKARHNKGYKTMTKTEANIEADFAQDCFDEAVEVLEAAGDDILAMHVPHEAIDALCNAQTAVCQLMALYMDKFPLDAVQTSYRLH